MKIFNPKRIIHIFYEKYPFISYEKYKCFVGLPEIIMKERIKAITVNTHYKLNLSHIQIEF